MSLSFKLYLITDRKAIPDQTLVLEEALNSGVKAVQLREKDLSGRELLHLGKKIRSLTRNHQAQFFFNERLDLALSTEADGIHCPEEGLPVAQIRERFPKVAIGKSVHSLRKALEAEKDGADFVTFSPIFSTPSKEGILEPQGLEQLALVASSLKIPVFALGGITPERAKECVKHGAHGVAVISAILKSNDVPRTVSQFEEALGGL